MNFFEHQDLARRNSRRLIGLFLAAVVLLIASTYLLIAGSLFLAGQTSSLWAPRLMALIGGGTLAVVGLSSLGRSWQLRRGGGRTVAEMLGGRLVAANTAHPHEKRLINVIQEMALAAGMPVPPVYLMPEEEGINAFAAGYSPQDAVVGVTEGAVRKLTRDQLQGVIAHEYSHILNGDMRLNIQMMGWIYGILVLGLIGEGLTRIFFRSGGMRSSGGSSRKGGKNEGGLILAIIAIAIGLIIIGFVGTFFGSLIKAAISRQREYLADAAAVQFTRNPQGISGALQRIGAPGRGSLVASPAAAEASHFFFSSALSSGLSDLMHTHPPLEDRIRRIDPSWDGKFPEITATSEPAATDRPAKSRRPDPLKSLAALSAIAHIGQIQPQTLQEAVSVRDRLPEQLLTCAEDPYSARLVVFALLLDPAPQPRADQLALLKNDLDAALIKDLNKIIPLVDSLDVDLRLPLIEIATQSLKAISALQYRIFRSTIAALIACDQKLQLFEWMLQRLLLRHLEPAFSAAPVPRVHYYGLRQLIDPCRLLLSTLALSGAAHVTDARTAFAAGMKHLGLTEDLLPASACSLPQLDESLGILETAAPKLKKKILEACVLCVSRDNQITPAEAQLMRGISDALGCPLPMAGIA